MELEQATRVEIREASEKADFLMCWDVARELHPHLSEDRYLTLMLYMLDEGYRMIYIKEGRTAVAFCGYRYTTMLHRGRSVYIDDLGTLTEARERGYATALLQHVIEEARRQELQSIHLDSAYADHDAQRLCIGLGFRLDGHHFAMAL